MDSFLRMITLAPLEQDAYGACSWAVNLFGALQVALQALQE
jgi:hypothetical protein